MKSFHLVQRGTFIKEATNEAKLINGIVDLEYMGSTEFEWGAIPKAYRRIMWDFLVYDISLLGIRTSEGQELKVFCRIDRTDKTIDAIRRYIENPWELQEYSRLEYVTRDNAELKFNTNFWWGIDIDKPVPDWMVFFESREEQFRRAIQNDYENWWLKMPKAERKKEYEESLTW